MPNEVAETSTSHESQQAVGSPLERGVGRLAPQRANARTRPCPDPVKGKRCPLCGGEYVCLQSWRPKA